MTRPAYFVGTIGLDTASEVFGEVGRCLGGHVRQVPDGEVAGRRQWVTYQLPVLRSYGFLRPQPPNRFVPLELADGFDAADVRFAELGYAREARTSYVDFVAARDRGLIAPGVRFQVGMPTPFAVLRAFLSRLGAAPAGRDRLAPRRPSRRRTRADAEMVGRQFQLLRANDSADDRGLRDRGGNARLCLHAARAGQTQARRLGPFERKVSDHLGFGHGVHQCVGNNLALLEMASLFRELLPRVKRFHVGERRRAFVNLLQIYASLEVTIDPA